MWFGRLAAVYGGGIFCLEGGLCRGELVISEPVGFFCGGWGCLWGLMIRLVFFFWCWGRVPC